MRRLHLRRCELDYLMTYLIKGDRKIPFKVMTSEWEAERGVAGFIEHKDNEPRLVITLTKQYAIDCCGDGKLYEHLVKLSERAVLSLIKCYEEMLEIMSFDCAMYFSHDVNLALSLAWKQMYGASAKHSAWIKPIRAIYHLMGYTAYDEKAVEECFRTYFELDATNCEVDDTQFSMLQFSVPEKKAKIMHIAELLIESIVSA